MSLKNFILTLLLANLSFTIVHSHPQCEEYSGVVYTDECVKHDKWKWQYKKGWYRHEEVVCTEYTCKNLGCDHNFAKPLCPVTCGNCTNVVDIVNSTSSFSWFVKFLCVADLVNLLEGPDHFTVFVPTNEAFENLSDTILDNYLDAQWIEHLRSLLLHHILSGWASSDYLYNIDGLHLRSIGGNIIEASIDPLRVNDAEILTENITAINGILHVVDNVLLPTSALMSVADYTTDPSRDYTTSEFARFIELAGITDLFSSLDPLGAITVFVPTNQAFRQIVGVVDESNKTAVRDLIEHHVIRGITLLRDITDGLEVMAGNSEILEFSNVNKNIRINDDATLIQADILVTNGVIHLIDHVLTPTNLCRDTNKTYKGYTCKDMASSKYKRSLCYHSTNCPRTCGQC